MALTTEHLEDLKRSGLSDETIKLLRLDAIRPQDIKLRGVTSAMRIPYWNLDGSMNCFERSKLFPAITTADGHTQKYYQVPDSTPHLYLPPFFSWSIVAKSADCNIQITEGEKKAASLSERGHFCLGIAGVWNWRQKSETGERLVIPTLDQFVWAGRVVELIPDSDVWRPDKQQALSGFYALGQELISRGASVRFLKLPDHAAKVGLDDWLVAAGADWEHQWPHLERLPLDHARLAPVAAWWQTWREKQATQHALKQHDMEALELTEAVGLYTVRSSAHAVKFIFERLNDSRGGVQAELTVMLGQTELLSNQGLGLTSDSGQTKLVSSLKHLTASVPWRPLLQRACSLVLRRHRHGEPIVELAPAASSVVPFLLNPIIYQQHQTLMFAPGGTCKSYLALWFSLLVGHGAHHAGVAGLKAPVLYLDWELNEETVGGRLKALRAGHPELAHHTPFYRRCELPLHQDAHQIAAEVAARDIKLLIVDSAAMACGGELSSPEAAINLQRALRKIGCASLVLAHTSKSVQEGQDRTAYGTVFFRELARNVWELTKADDENPVKLALSQVKNNFGPKHAPLGFALTFSGEQVRVDSQDLAAEPAFQTKLPTPARIRNLLEDGVLRTSREIAEELGMKLATVKSALSREKGHKWQQVGEDYRNLQWTVLRAK
ncbi:MAG: DUF3854 domain-containing protein [Nitrospirota bacterium]